MSDEQKNSWDSLAEQLGAKPKPEVESKIDQPAPAKPAESQEKEYKEPSRPASGWDSLLGDFGFQAAPEPVAKKAEPAQPSSPSADSDDDDDELVTDVDWHDDLFGGQSESEETAIFVRPAEEDPSSLDQTVEFDASEIDRIIHDEPQDDEVSGEAKQDKSRPNKQPEAASQESPAEAPQQEEPPKSKWDIAPKSQLSLPEWFPFAGKRSKPPLLPPEENNDHLEETLLEKPRSEEPTLFVDPEALDEPASEEPKAAESEENTPEEGQAKRPRGRRRRGRRRRSSTAGAEAPSTAQEEAAEAVDEAAAAFGSVADSIENRADEPIDDLDDDDDDPQGGSRGGKHRSVPSWSEAIGVVVDANIAARAERRRAGGRAPSGSGGGRGRRGGRRRGRKPSSN